MVLTHKVGKERSFGVVLLLGIVTFGIYFIVWHWKAHSEVFKQFELQREGKDEGVVWLVLGVLFQPLLWVYQFIFVSNVRYVRERLGHRDGISPGAFLGMHIPGNVLYYVGSTMLFLGLQMVIFSSMPVDADDPEAPSQDELDRLGRVGRILMLVGVPFFLAGLALSIIAFARLQGDINRLWRAFDQRMGAVMQQAPPGWGYPAAAPQTAPAAAAWPRAPPPPPPPGPARRP